MRLHYIIQFLWVGLLSLWAGTAVSWTACVLSLGNKECTYREDTLETTAVVNQKLTEQKLRRKSDWNCLQQRCDSDGTSRSIKRDFIHLVVCLTTGPKPLPKRALHSVWSWTSSFKWEYPLLSLRSSSSFPRLLPRLPVTSIPLLSFLQ
jgi:hypothetical protein